MNTINDGGPAFPREDYQADDSPGQRGMSLRDYFAAAAMKELLSQEGYESFYLVAFDSYGVADAMLKAREGEEMNKWQELEAAAKSATPGPWVAAGPSFGDPLPRYCNEVLQDGEDYVDPICRAPQEIEDACTADMEYIAAANPAAILELLAELADAKTECVALRATEQNLREELAEARKQMEAQKDEWLSWEAKRRSLEKDAERYRWLRDGTEWEPFDSAWLNRNDIYGCPTLAMDEAIDAAMQKGKP